MKKALFIMGGPGSGKDYLINNVLNKFNVTEVQIDQLFNGSVRNIVRSGKNLLVNSTTDLDKVQIAKSVLEGFEFHHLVVSVSNFVSYERNKSRSNPMNEVSRTRRLMEAESLPASLKNSKIFVFDNSINLVSASKAELSKFQLQIENYLKFMIDNGYIFEDFNDIQTKPVLSKTPIQRKKKLKVPPNSMNARIDGAGGYSIGGLTQTYHGVMVTNSFKPNFKKFINEYKK